MLAGEYDWDVDASAYGFMELGIEPLHFDGREACLFQELTGCGAGFLRHVGVVELDRNMVRPQRVVNALDDVDHNLGTALYGAVVAIPTVVVSGRRNSLKTTLWQPCSCTPSNSACLTRMAAATKCCTMSVMSSDVMSLTPIVKESPEAVRR